MSTDQGASPRGDRAATPSEPSQSSVVSGVAGIPCAWSDAPWFFEEAETRKRQYIVRSQNGRANGGCGMVVADKIESNHDAKLIAAAPDLFKALAEVINDSEALFDIKWRDQAWAALRKARGQ